MMNLSTENHTYLEQSQVGTQEHEFNLLLKAFNNIYINTNPDRINKIKMASLLW